MPLITRVIVKPNHIRHSNARGVTLFMMGLEHSFGGMLMVYLAV